MYNIPIPPIEIRIGDLVKKLVNDTDAYAYLNAVANNSPSTARWSNGYTFDEKVPASEWNWTFGQMTRLMFRMRKDLYSSCNEMMNFIKDKIPGASFSDTDDINPDLSGTNHQLKDAVDRAIYVDRTIIAGTQAADPDTHQSPLGSVATSNANGKVSVDPSTGVMTANGLGDIATVGSIVNPNGLTSIAAILANIINVMYPVGSIYTTTALSTPEQVMAKFGGTWEAYGQGRVLVGAGSGTDPYGTTQTFTAGATGGYYSIKLSAGNLPAHYHGLGAISGSASFIFRGVSAYNNGNILVRSVGGTMASKSNSGTGVRYAADFTSGSSGDDTATVTVNKNTLTQRSDGGYTAQSGGSAISGSAHENKQPYVVVYMYRRTA